MNLKSFNSPSEPVAPVLGSLRFYSSPDRQEAGFYATPSIPPDTLRFAQQVFSSNRQQEAAATGDRRHEVMDFLLAGVPESAVGIAMRHALARDTESRQDA
jgi:hypothetical protein